MSRSVIDWQEGVSVYLPNKCYNGYTLISDSAHWNLIDMKGRVVKKWFGDPLNRRGSQLFEMLFNSNFVSNGLNVIEQDWHGNVICTIPFRKEGKPPSSFYHHDVQRLLNGNYIVMIREYVDDPEISKVRLQDDHMMEITADKRVVWDWWGHDHYDEFELSEEGKRIIQEAGGGEVGAFPPGSGRENWFRGDWLHLNTIHVLPDNPLHRAGDSRFKPGNILSCSRNLNLIFIIDRKSGEIVWKWGAYSRMKGFWITGYGGTHSCLVGPHDPKMLDNGNILVYDNGGSGGYPLIVRFHSRLIELNPLSGEIVWEFIQEPRISHGGNRWLSTTTGGAQRLPNGNTLSLDSNQGRIFEITPMGEIVWEYISRKGFYRTQRISYEDCYEADPNYMRTDGHLKAKSAIVHIPEYMGLPVKVGSDYCPRFQ